MVWVFLVSGILLVGFLGIPVGVGLGLIGLSILHFVAGDAMALAVPTVWNVFSDYVLSAIPLFILMGEVLLISGASERMYGAVAPLFHKIPGGLLHSNIAVATIFGAVSGASTSTAAAVGSIAYPELKKRGYDKKLVVATLAAGGTQGLLIPPSLSLLIYGATQGVSIAQLFMAGILPALLIAVAFMVLIFIIVSIKPELAPRIEQKIPFFRSLAGLLRIWPVIILIFAVLGTIYVGIATPTEAAGLGVAAAVIIGFTWGDLTPRKLVMAAVNSTIVFGTLAVLILGAVILAQAISILGVPSQVAGLIGDLNISPLTAFALVVLLYLILGCFFDGISLLLMTLPVIFPVMTGMGFDAVWLGVIITLLIEIGMLTPPVGLNLFVLISITRGEVSLGEAALATVPFWLLMVGAIGLFTMFPSIILYLPSLLK